MRGPYIRFELKIPSGRHPLEFKRLSKSYDGHKVIEKFTANVERGEKIAIIGRNGSGKTTLIKSLIRNATGDIDDADRHFPVDGGHVKWGHEAAVGYFAQDTTDTIAKNTTVIEWLHQFDPKRRSRNCAPCWGRCSSAAKTPRNPRAHFPEANQARLIFCKLMLQKPNVLVFDEPTNHLDLEAINALNIALQKYPGTVLFVTHDHDVIDEVATRIWQCKGGHVEDFKGPYEDFLVYAKQKAS